MQFSLVGSTSEGEGANITVWVHGRDPQVAHSDHPHFAQIVEGALSGDESVIDLFDLSAAVATKFDRLSERVTVANGRVYLDGEEVNDTLTNQVVRFYDEGVDDWKPLVAFFEKVATNPQEHSREQLYTWLDKRDFTITEDGDIVGYKGVAKLEDGTLVSQFSGTAIVDGEVKNGQIPNYLGAVVEMPRSEVTFDPATGCSVGLHVGSYEYANSFAAGALLEVHVNPRDVVSVPTDSHWQKMRVCRYKVVDTIDKPYTSPVRSNDDYYYYCDECGAAHYEEGLCDDCYNSSLYDSDAWGEHDYDWG